MEVTTSSDEDWHSEEEDGSDDDYVPSLCVRYVQLFINNLCVLFVLFLNYFKVKVVKLYI